MKFIKSLQFIFKPSFWFMNDEYSKQVDSTVNKIIDEDLIVLFDAYYADTGKGIKVWIKNYPYAYATLHTYISGQWSSTKIDGRPSRLTILRFRKYVDKKIGLQLKEKLQ